MFTGCTDFNEPLDFDTSQVEYMNEMFSGCTNFNQNLTHWDTSRVLHYRDMFENCGIPDEFKPTFLEQGENANSESYKRRRRDRINAANDFERIHFNERFRERVKEDRKEFITFTHAAAHASPKYSGPHSKAMQLFFKNLYKSKINQRESVLKKMGPPMPSRGKTRKPRSKRKHRSRRKLRAT